MNSQRCISIFGAVFITLIVLGTVLLRAVCWHCLFPSSPRNPSKNASSPDSPSPNTVTLELTEKKGDILLVILSEDFAEPTEATAGKPAVTTTASSAEPKAAPVEEPAEGVAKVDTNASGLLSLPKMSPARYRLLAAVFALIVVAIIAGFVCYFAFPDQTQSIVGSVKNWLDGVHDYFSSALGVTGHKLLRVGAIFAVGAVAALSFAFEYLSPASLRGASVFRAILSVLRYAIVVFMFFCDGWFPAVMCIGLGLAVENSLMPAMGSIFQWSTAKKLSFTQGIEYVGSKYKLNNVGAFVFGFIFSLGINITLLVLL